MGLQQSTTGHAAPSAGEHEQHARLVGRWKRQADGERRQQQ